MARAVHSTVRGPGFHVIRYDNRDYGQSSCFDFAKQPYNLDDLARDALGVLDAYDVSSPHTSRARRWAA